MLAFSIWLFLVHTGPVQAEKGVFKPGKDHREAEVTYGWYTLSVDPLDSLKKATLKNCHTLKWHTVRGMDKSDFGTVVSVEFGIEANLINESVTLKEPDSLGNTLESSTKRDELGVQRYPFTIYGGLQFSPLAAQLFSLCITGGFSWAIWRGSHSRILSMVVALATMSS